MFIIKDWIDKTCFFGRTFESFDDAEEFLCLTLNDEYDDDRGEYYITEVPEKEDYRIVDGRYITL